MKNKIKKLLTFKVVLLILLVIGIYFLFKISEDLKDIKSEVRIIDFNVNEIEKDVRPQTGFNLMPKNY